MRERWRNIDGFPNYEISTNGRVYSRKRDLILTPFHDGWGYKKVSLRNHGKRSDKSIHRLVANAFIPNPLGKPEINHIDGDKNNNCVDNLEWVTSSENKRHAFHVGLNDRKSYNAGKPKRKVLLVGTNQVFDSVSKCAEYLNCTHTNVLSCLQGRTETCKGYHVEYVNK